MSLSPEPEQPESEKPTTNSKQQQQNKNKKKQESDILDFNEGETDLFKDVTEKDLGWDNEDFTDLQTEIQIPETSDKDLEGILANKSIKTLVRDEQDNPTIGDTLKNNEEVGRLTNEEVIKLKKDYVDEKNNLIVWLAAKSTISLHIWAGNRDGKAIWVEKEFRFNSINKKQEMDLNMLNSRVRTISMRSTLLQNKPMNTLSDGEKRFMVLAPMMIDIAAYRLSEREAKLRLGMTTDDFAKVQVDEYTLALQVLVWRTQNIPFSKRGR